MNYIIEQDLSFDYQLLANQYQTIKNYASARGDVNHINLKKPHHLSDNQGLTYGATSLYDYSVRRYTKFQHEYTDYISAFSDYDIINTIKQVEKHALDHYNLAIGRVRLLTLPPKMCLTYHNDAESEVRFHIPIITNDNIFFIINGQAEQMKYKGSLYTLDVKQKHTAINASRDNRVHLVLDGYKNES